MGVLSYRQMSNEDLCQFANQVKDIIAEKLNIPELDECAIVIVEKGMFGKAWNKFWNKDESAAQIKLMKCVPEIKQ